jgi:uncharacterized membrane protein
METSEKEGSQGAGTPLIGPAPGSVSTWSRIAVAFLIAFYLATSIHIASHRPFWFDEIFTALISRLPNWSTMSEALKADNNMPLPYFLVVHLFDKCLGHTEVAARLPSALGIAGGLVIAFDCARRLTDDLHGLIAVSFLTCSFLPYFGYEARSYGISFMFAALLFWVWTHANDRKISSALLFGCVIFMGVIFHYYFVLCLVPYAAWQASRWRRWRPPSPKLVAGALGIGCAAAVLLGQIFGAHRYSGSFWSKPSLYLLRETFSGIFPDFAFLFTLVMILIAWVAATEERIVPLPPMSSAEGAGWLSLSIPFFGYVLAKLVTNAFVDRYFIGMLPGIAVAFACLLWRHFRDARLIPIGIFLLLSVVGIYRQVEVVRHPESIDPFSQQTQTRKMLRLEHDLRNDGKRFFLFSTGMLYFPAHFYSEHPEEYVLLEASDQALEVSNTLRYVVSLDRYYPVQTWNLEDLKKHARETAFIQPLASDLNAMQEAGFQTTMHLSLPVSVAYLE